MDRRVRVHGDWPTTLDDTDRGRRRSSDRRPGGCVRHVGAAHSVGDYRSAVIAGVSVTEPVAHRVAALVNAGSLPVEFAVTAATISR
jgi:hypothetical protein